MIVIRQHRLVGLAARLRLAGFPRLALTLERIPSAGPIRQVRVPSPTWAALVAKAPALAEALRADLGARGFTLLVKVPRRPRVITA